jgi:putative ABC transport system ATP-binding protein
MKKNIIALHKITKIYRMGEFKVHALKGIDLKVAEGEFIAVMGPSGSGKSTLMSILGCLDVPTSGEYVLDGKEVSKLSKDQLACVRNAKIGFVFQNFNLLPQMSAIENVELPMMYKGIKKPLRTKIARDCLAMVGLHGREHHKPTQLSGGQRQRVAIARALANNPSIILADEPTGNLDSTVSHEIMELFSRLNDEAKVTIILVTHEHDIASFAKRTITLRDGIILSGETENDTSI